MVNHNRASFVITMSLLSFLFCINVEAMDQLLFYTRVKDQQKAILDSDQSRTMVEYRQSNKNRNQFVISGKRYTLDDETGKFSPFRKSTRTGIDAGDLQDEYTIEHDNYIKHGGKYYQVEWFSGKMIYGNIGDVTYERDDNGKLKANTGVSLQWPPLEDENITLPSSSSSSSSSSSTASSASSASSASLAPTTTASTPSVLTPPSTSTSTSCPSSPLVSTPSPTLTIVTTSTPIPVTTSTLTSTLAATTTTNATRAATSTAVMPTGGATSSSSSIESLIKDVSDLAQTTNRDIKSIELKNDQSVDALQSRMQTLEESMQKLLAHQNTLITEANRFADSQKQCGEDHKKLHATINPFYKKPMDYLATAAMTIVPALQWKSLLIPAIKAVAPKVAAAITPAVAPWIAPVLAGSGGLWWLYTTYVRKKACDEFDQTYYRMNRPWHAVVYAEGKNLLKPLKDFAKMGIGIGLSVLILSNQKTSLPTL